MFKSVCYQLTDDQLNHTVDYEAEKQATIQWGIWQTIIDIIKLIFISFANGLKRNRNLAVKAAY